MCDLIKSCCYDSRDRWCKIAQPRPISLPSFPHTQHTHNTSPPETCDAYAILYVRIQHFKVFFANKSNSERISRCLSPRTLSPCWCGFQGTFLVLGVSGPFLDGGISNRVIRGRHESFAEIRHVFGLAMWHWLLLRLGTVTGIKRRKIRRRQNLLAPPGQWFFFSHYSLSIGFAQHTWSCIHYIQHLLWHCEYYQERIGDIMSMLGLFLCT